MRSSFRVECGHEGCKEVGLFQVDSMKERRELSLKYPPGKWRCVRHRAMDEVLGVNNLRIVKEVVSERRDTGLYWGRSGFMHGPGFKAFCDDFPEGTKLRVTAEIVLPEG